MSRFFLKNNVVFSSRFLPQGGDHDTTMCDPWQAQKFYKRMRAVPDDTCDQCLPDCEGTFYSASVTAVPFRDCDDKNMGVRCMRI